MWFNVNNRILRDNLAAQIQEGLKVRKLKLADKIVIGMFVFGVAFALVQRATHQVVPENSVAEISPTQVEIVEPAS